MVVVARTPWRLRVRGVATPRARPPVRSSGIDLTRDSCGAPWASCAGCPSGSAAELPTALEARPTLMDHPCASWVKRSAGPGPNGGAAAGQFRLAVRFERSPRRNIHVQRESLALRRPVVGG